MKPEITAAYDLLKCLRKTLRSAGVVSACSLSASVLATPQALADQMPQASKKTRQRQTPKAKTSAHEIGLEAGVLFPPTRPALGVHYGSRFRDFSLSARLQGSWVSVAQSFSDAASQSEYADRLSDASGELGELTLSVPELGYRFTDKFILSLSPIFRFTQCVATYKTKNDNSLSFSSLGFSAGIAPSFALQLGRSGTLEIGAGLQFPFFSIGTAALDYTQNSSSPLADFSEEELDSILKSLQPYAKELSEGLTLQLGIRWLWAIN